MLHKKYNAHPIVTQYAVRVLRNFPPETQMSESTDSNDILMILGDFSLAMWINSVYTQCPEAWFFPVDKVWTTHLIDDCGSPRSRIPSVQGHEFPSY